MEALRRAFHNLGHRRTVWPLLIIFAVLFIRVWLAWGLVAASLMTVSLVVAVLSLGTWILSRREG